MGLAFLITADHLQLLSERKVLKADEYAALLGAGDVIQAAQREATRVRAEAHRQCEQRLREGYEQGWREAQAAHARRHAADAFAAERALYAQRETMARLVVEALAQCLGEVAPPLRLAAALRRIEGLLAEEPVVTIQVAPAAHEAALAAVRETLGASRHAGQVRVIVCEELQGDACRVQTASGHVDIGWQAQLEALRAALPELLPDDAATVSTAAPVARPGDPA